MIYVQPQISCTLPLKLFVRSKHLIDSDIIEKKDRRTISRPCQHKIKHYAEYTHTCIHTNTQTQTHIYPQYTQTHTHTHTHTYSTLTHTHTHTHTNIKVRHQVQLF